MKPRETTGVQPTLTDIYAPPAPAPAPVSQPEVDYMSMFQSALGASRAGVERQFTMALGDIAQREGIANQAIGELPGQLTTIYGQGDAAATAATRALDSAQAASGLTSFMGAGAQMAPIQAARAGDLASRQADVPLLRLGVQTEMSRQRGLVEQERAAAAAEAQGRLASLYADLAASQVSRRAAGDDDLRNRQWALEDAASERRYADRVRREEQSFQERMARAGEEESGEMSKVRKDEIRRSQRYQDARSLMVDRPDSGGVRIFGRRLGGSTNGPVDPVEIVRKYRAYPQLLRVLAEDYPDIAAVIAAGEF